MRVYNFSAGPATLPKEVLEEVQKELVEYQNDGMSVLEMSHRSPMYEKIINEAREDLRKLMNIPNNYHILFLQGGATLQFTFVPSHLLKNTVGIIHTGVWTKRAIDEAKKIGNVEILGSSESDNFDYIPKVKIDKDIDYLYYCDNNTIMGTKFKKVPETSKPIVCDMSSSILSEKIDVSKFGIIFAGAQKNIGPAGVTIVIIRDDLVDTDRDLPTYLKYRTHVDKESMYNTPPTFNIYVCGKVFKNLLKQGGIEVIEKKNKEKAKMLYDTLDNSSFYKTTVSKEDRSNMNVTFLCPTEELDNKFIIEAKKQGLVNLKGHRIKKGIRASIYNAMPVEGVKKLIKFMKEFEKQNV